MKVSGYFCLVLGLASFGMAMSSPVRAEVPDHAEVVAKALAPTTDWPAPLPGPRAQPDRNVVYLAASLRNGGILAVGEGLSEAAAAIGWSLDVRNARGEDGRINEILTELSLNPPDALVVGGFDAVTHASALGALAALGTKIVGWHAGAVPGPIPNTPVELNVTTDPYEVARVAASYAIALTGGEARAVIFTDERYGIAVTKSTEMARVIDSCDRCEVLEIVNLKLDETQKEMPTVIERLMATYGDRWNATLGINDLYFDDAALPLAFAGVAPNGQIVNISAGDGSFTAYKRIRIDNFQAATVPEPLNYQGWQLVDELNRLFAGEPVTGFVAPTKLVIPQNVDADGGVNNIFDPENGYREAFAANW